MISIRPKHLVNILNGYKTLELRKTVPKDYKGWVYVYCIKGVGKTKYHHLYNLTSYNNGKTLFSITHHNKYSLVPDGFLNGKVVARFWFDEYEKLEWFDASLGGENLKRDYNYWYLEGNGKYVSVEWLLVNLYLTKQQVIDYGNGKDLYAWLIKKLEVFDKPMELSNFYNFKTKINLTRPPQSWQYVWVKEVNNE